MSRSVHLVLPSRSVGGESHGVSLHSKFAAWGGSSSSSHVFAEAHSDYIYIYLESPKTFFFCVFVLGLICLRFCSKNAFLEMRLKVYIISCPKNQGPSAGESFEGPNPCGTCRVRSPSSSEGPMMVRVELLSEKASVQV